MLAHIQGTRSYERPHLGDYGDLFFRKSTYILTLEAMEDVVVSAKDYLQNSPHLVYYYVVK